MLSSPVSLPAVVFLIDRPAFQRVTLFQVVFNCL